MKQEKDPQVIFIKDLLFVALYQWRQIFAAALVFAAILGGIVTVSEWKHSSTPSEQIQAAAKAYEEQKLLLEEKRDQIQKLIDSQEAYNIESPVMLLDPYGVYKASVELTVQTDYEIFPGMVYQTPDNTDAILHSYAVHLAGNQVLQSVADATGLKTKYLAELISLENGGSSTRSLSITVNFYNSEGAEQILDILIDCVQATKPQIDRAIGEHSINIVPSGVSEQIDLSITEKQTTAVNRLDTLQTTLADLVTQQAALQEAAPSNGSISVKNILTFSVVGAVLGAGLVVCIAWVVHIAGAKVYSARTLKNRTGVRVLACVPTQGKKHPIDCWLKKLEGRNLEDNQYSFAAANIRNYCSDKKNVLLVANSNNSNTQTILAALAKVGQQVTICQNLLHDAASLEALPKCDAVVLLEQCGCTTYTDVERSMELVADQGKELLGCILLNG